MTKENTRNATWKYIWMTLTIIFFLLWIFTGITKGGNDNLFEEYQHEINSLAEEYKDALNAVQSDCDDNMYNLHTHWQNAYNSLKNCYQNGLPSCEAIVPPSLN